MMTTSARFVAVVACAVLCDGLTRTIGRSAFAPARSPLPANDRARRRGAGASLTMKRKGKGAGGGGRVPGTGPPVGVQEQQRAYADYQKTRETSGLPSFDLYVKGPKSPMWYPAGSLGGDDKSRDLVEQYMGGLLSGVAKGGIDRGVASSLFPEQDKFVAKVLETYPQLKRTKNDLKFGYKVTYEGLVEKRPEAKEVTELTPDMQDSVVDKFKKNLGF